MNDSPARSVAGQWLHTVKLNPGVNAITVTLSTQAGSSTTVMHNVTYDPVLAPEVSLQLLNGPERAPLDAAFTLQLKPGSLLHITNMQIDYDSDGIVDLDSANPASSLTHRYLQPGIYTATAAVTLDDDVPATPAVLVNTDIKVLVEHPDEYRLTLCAVFDGMRAALMADDITTALTALHPSLRTSWQASWSDLGAELASISAGLGNIVSGQVAPFYADMLIARPLVAQPGVFRAGRLQLERSQDGIWRITSM